VAAVLGPVMRLAATRQAPGPAPRLRALERLQRLQATGAEDGGDAFVAPRRVRARAERRRAHTPDLRTLLSFPIHARMLPRGDDTGNGNVVPR